MHLNLSLLLFRFFVSLVMNEYKNAHPIYIKNVNSRFEIMYIERSFIIIREDENA